MHLREYCKKKNRLLSGQLLVALLCTAVVGWATRQVIVTGIVAICSVVLIVLTVRLNRLDDCWITDIVSDLSVLIDTLTELEETRVFPEAADTATSKLQNKVIRLSRMLKKKSEDACQEQENVKGLVSDISHQLKTPLANLKMYADFLTEETITEEQRQEYTGIIISSIDRLNFLSESMIKVSRLESGLIHVKLVSQSLNETVLKAIKDVFQKAQQKNVELTFHESGDSIVCHDRNWTAEAVFNLLDNAVKYAQQGSVVSISIQTLGMFVMVEVADENQPIPEAEFTKVFQRFYRGINSGKTDGIGVGLYLAQEITVRQGGYINLRSGNDGNTFSLFLPLSP